ncbi:MAG: MBL fold metallo-hydrolase [Saprospiraceae bacterium]|nr:MBL fold metallo-hydrolase [Saprospiraceae bacterium]
MNIKTFIFNPFSENTYLIWDEDKIATVIDPGFYTEKEEKEFFVFIHSNQLKLKHCILSHAHIDHILGCKRIYEEYNLLPLMHSKEIPVYASGPEISKMYGLGSLLLPDFNILLDEQEILYLGKINFEVIFTPGHSPGSISLFNRTEEILFSGDVLFEGSIGRTDLPGGDFNTLIHSIQSKLMILPHGTKVFSGHGPMTTIGQEKLTNPFL